MRVLNGKLYVKALPKEKVLSSGIYVKGDGSRYTDVVVEDSGVDWIGIGDTLRVNLLLCTDMGDGYYFCKEGDVVCKIRS